MIEDRQSRDEPTFVADPAEPDLGSRLVVHNGLDPARGCLLGLVIAIAIWVLVVWALAVWVITG